LHNEPDGKGGRHFVDVTRQAGLPRQLWTTSAAWADFDGDGFPDLYVCQYVDWSLNSSPIGTLTPNGMPRDVSPPQWFTGLPHYVFRNNGNGTFSDISKDAGLRPYTGDRLKDSENGKGLGVVAVDVNGDGKPDLYVANDTVAKFLYLNKSTRGRIRFEELGLTSGVALDDIGAPNGSMGIDAGDPFDDGRPSLWCTNYENEHHGLYRNQGRGLFQFSSNETGIADIGHQYVGFGTGFLDLDHDGWEDLVITNGRVMRLPRGRMPQRPVLLRNQGNGRFAELTAEGGTYFRSKHTGRGLAIGDLDNDGYPDLVISHLNEPVVILRNQAHSGKHWIGFEVNGKDHRDIAGAKVVVEVGGRKLTRFVKGGGSYLSSSDRRLLFGLDAATQIKQITVFWPWGQQQHWPGAQLMVDRYWRLREEIGVE
jgi:hypothetical protein